LRLRIRAPPEWGVKPVPAEHRILRGTVFRSLVEPWRRPPRPRRWIASRPGAGLLEALLISLAGSLIGSLMLSSAGLVGSRYGVPTMVFLRPVLGIMGQAASSISGRFLGEFTHAFWVAVFAAWCAGLAIGDPLVFVRKWLERVAIWLVYFSAIWITVQVFSSPKVWEVFARSGDGSLPILLALDLVIAMPISWWPLISDYNRFSSTVRGGFIGTFLGYTMANTWFYFLGAALISVMGIQDIIASISLLLLGNLALLFILVDETDNCFADIYSAAVSIQNIAPKARQWKLVIAVTAIGAVLATTIPLAQYEWFLLMIGGLFVPLLGVLVADYLIGTRRGGLSIAAFYEEAPKLRLVSMIAWAAGIALYFLIVNLCPSIGASLPSFALSAGLLALMRIFKKG